MIIIEIEKNIPIPPKNRKLWKSPEDYNRFPFSEMETGDSFFVPITDYEEYLRLSKAINGQMHYYGKLLGRKYSMRKIKEQNGIRVWRIK